MKKSIMYSKIGETLKFINNMKKETRKSNDPIGGLLSDSNRYSTKKGLISLVGPCMATIELFEIFCLEGDLFDDIERYDTEEEALNRIKELLL